MYTIQDDHYGKLIIDKKDPSISTFEPFGRAVRLVRIYQTLETDDIMLDLSYNYLDKPCTLTMHRADLTKNNMSNLRAKGIDAFEHTSVALIETIRLQEKDKQIELLHKSLGWRDIHTGNDSERVFLTGIDSPQTAYKYDGTLKLTKAGTLDGWLQVINDHVIGYTPIEVSLILGFSAIVQGYLAADVGEATIFAHVFGDSSSGKTTGLKLALSTAGAPFKVAGVEGLFYSWNATQNALLRPLAYNFGYPILFDESSEFNGDFSRIIYCFSEGRDKARLNQNADFKESPSFATTILSTGEHSLLGKSKRNTGLRVRVLEFGSYRWTQSAKHAEDIIKGISQNYGHANEVLADYMKTIPKNEIIEAWHEWREVFIQTIIKPDAFTDRISAKYATLLLTTALINKCFQFNIDIQKIMEFLTTNENNRGETRDIALAAYNYLISDVVANFDKFGKRTSKPSLNNNRQEAWGYLETLKNDITLLDGSTSSKRLVILPEKAKAILTQGGFEDDSIIIRKWKANGWLDCDKDRNTRKRLIGSVNLPAYVIYVIEEDPKDEDDAQDLLPDKDVPVPKPILPPHKRPKSRPTEVHSYEDILKLDEAEAMAQEKKTQQCLKDAEDGAVEKKC